jgi:nitrite reductase/ring-hydroxylating ferredoxin subunit
MDLTPEYLEFKKKVDAQRKVVARKQALADKQREILKGILNNCPHEELEVKEYYFEGSYYDKAYTDRWHQCKLCGQKGPVTTNMHSWYG